MVMVHINNTKRITIANIYIPPGYSTSTHHKTLTRTYNTVYITSLMSLLPTIPIILETVIYSQLYEYFELHNIITNSQYELLKCHSPEKLTDRITN